ncbi:MAG: hypothetical protein ACXACR_11945, partial [Candidatus Hodarchaeales archaeon]
MFGDPLTFCRTIAERSQLKEGSRGVRQLILEMYRRQHQKVSNKELSRIVRIPVPVLSAVRSEMVSAGFLKTKSLFTSEALEWIQEK